MRTPILVTLSCCLFPGPAVHCWAQDKPEIENIRSLEQKWTETYRQRQVDALSSLLADDYIITMEDGITYSKVGFLSFTAKTSERVDLAEVSDLKIRMHGDTAIVTGAYHERGASAGDPYDYHERLTDVWMKLGGKWMLVASHYSVPTS